MTFYADTTYDYFVTMDLFSITHNLMRIGGISTK